MDPDHNPGQYIALHDLGMTDYGDALKFQESLFEAALARRLAAKTDPAAPLPENHLILCEHPPVFTLGKNGHEEHLLLSADEMHKRSFGFYRNNRGGDITYHGPGQLVGYPILDLEQFRPDVKAYMRALEEVIIKTLAEYGLQGGRIESATGVWLDAEKGPRARKICAFGVKISRWITMHGWALNVSTNLEHFRHIVPCGIADKGVTSMQAELGESPDMEAVKAVLLEKFGDVFGMPVRTTDNE